MIKLDFSPSQIDSFDYLASKLNTIAKHDEPDFATYKPDFQNIEKLRQKYYTLEHFVVIGRGGSITSTEAIYKTLGWFQGMKHVELCNSADPDFIRHIKEKCPPDNTLVITVSKSGTNVELLENTFAFAESYPVLAITGTDDNPLRRSAKVLQWDIVDHPPIGGRFSGSTECAFTPAGIIGINVQSVFTHMRKAHKKYAPCIPIQENEALKLAATLYALEQKGFWGIFFSIYSVQVHGFAELTSQLFHESICKDKEQGQTLIALLSPESQHHFTQRFYGGRKNMLGIFLYVENFQDNSAKTIIPPGIKDTPLRDGTLGDLDNVPLGKAIQFEYEGNREDTINSNIPLITIGLDQVNEQSTGELMALLQYNAVYGAWLRGVDPFDQPHVESSKAISFEKRKKYSDHVK